MKILRGGRVGAAVSFVTAVAAFLPSAAVAVAAGDPASDILLERDASGTPVLPDLHAARTRRAAPRGGGNELTFTYDSPSNPWSTEELDTLVAAIDDFYPVIKQVYGDPAFDITVNVRKDPAHFAVGTYNPSSNEMVLRGTFDLTVLCHEMIHAFRDDSIVQLTSYEEGMTRAAEIEVFNRVLTREHSFDEAHGYTYDVYYEALNTAAIGAKNGQFFFGYVAPLLRYQLGGYAWGKALIETPTFFHDFNAALYAAILVDPTTAGDEADLVAMAAAAAATLEGRPFADWYAAQHVLNTSPEEGYFLYQRINQFTIDFFRRIDIGNEIMQGGAAIAWEVYDFEGTLLDSGSDVTSAFGLISFAPGIPVGYQGRIEVVARASTPEGDPVISRAVRQAGEQSGVFGVVTGADTGTVTITPLAAPGSAVTVSVVDGAFYAPTLRTIAGTMTAEFTGSSASVTRTFTKDASDYFVLLAVPECGDGEVNAPGEECDELDEVDGDGCDTNCTLTACGNGILTAGEECDDGNDAGDDGCTAACESELIPGGSKTAECSQEFLVSPAPPLDAKGFPSGSIVCTDGAACDSGPAGDGQCTISVALCLNVEELRFECAAGDVARVELVRPRQDAPKGPVDTANRDAIESVLTGIGGTVAGRCLKPAAARGLLCSADADCDSDVGTGDGDCSGRFVAFDPALEGTTACSTAAHITVPAKSDTDSGNRVLLLRTYGSPDAVTGKDPKPDKDKLKLACLP